MSKLLRRSLAAETKILSSTERTARYVASSQALDSYREIVRAAGWKFDRFQKNAPFVDSHDYSSVGHLLGNVTAWRVEGDKLVEEVKFVPEGASPLADFAWKMSESGFLRAVSVGFLPVQIRSRWRDDKDFAEACRELGLSGEIVAQCQCIHWQQDQTELSLVLIGANPEAVAKAHDAGAVSDADLAGIGFGDDDLTFLHEAAEGWQKADAPLRRRLRAELRAITGGTQSVTRGSSATHPTAKTASRAAALGNDQRAESKAAVVTALRAAFR